MLERHFLYDLPWPGDVDTRRRCYWALRHLGRLGARYRNRGPELSAYEMLLRGLERQPRPASSALLTCRHPFIVLDLEIAFLFPWAVSPELHRPLGLGAWASPGRAGGRFIYDGKKER